MNREQGSLAIELSIVAPGIFLILGLIYAYGQVGGVSGTLEAGTRDAVRSATGARSEGEAQVLAYNAVVAGLGTAPPGCRDTVTVRVQGNFEPDTPITVVSECTYSLSSAGLPGVPGRITARSEFTSMLDPNRSVD